jgi:hypothetical protein
MKESVSWVIIEINGIRKFMVILNRITHIVLKKSTYINITLSGKL